MNIAISAVGLHTTTELCLEALQWLHERKEIRNTLDMGCGSGILSVTAASIWPTRVLAVDISEKAVDDTRKMAESHGLSDFIQVARSDGFANQLIKKNSPYDLICFNMLAEPLMEMAPLVKQQLAPGGVGIISGILSWQAADVTAVYNALDIDFIKELSSTPWHCFILCHKTETGFF